MRSDVKSHLTTLFPSTLEACRSSPRHTASNKDFHGILGVIVGEECLPIILPAAYYQCSIRPIDETLDGIDVGGQYITLSPTAQRTALLFRERVHGYINLASHFAELLLREQSTWIAPDECHANGIKYSLDLEFRTRIRSRLDVLQEQVVVRDGEAPRFGICDKCRETLVHIEDTFQDKLWSVLPLWCGRESWGKLRDGDA